MATYAYDLVLKNGRVIDPEHEMDSVLDVGVKDGRIAAVQASISGTKAREIIDLEGYLVFPGVIDSHVHVGKNRGIGYRMTAAAGVTTLVDFGSSMEEFAEEFAQRGVGQNAGSLYSINRDLSSRDAGRSEIERLVDEALAAGSLGIKIVGGHHPLTPETTSTIIDVANDRGCYIAFHLGTTETGSHIEGVREVPALVGDNRLHVAHVNSYCRGMIDTPAEEALEAASVLHGLKGQVVSESYLDTINGTGGRCFDGKPVSHVTRNCLTMKDYPPTTDGLRQAIADGYGHVRVQRGGRMVLITGGEAVEIWEERDTEVSMSFPVNSPQATFICATACGPDDEFIVDAISTDGGAIPRNVAVERGMALVRYGALSLSQLAEKLSAAGADMFGLTSKGHLGEGADADVTVIDPQTGTAHMTVASGRIIMLDGVVFPTEGRMITTECGAKTVKEAGFACEIADLQNSRLYR